MNYTWRRTPPLWAIRETQEYYAKMAAKGWMLQKRGRNYDRYRRAAPQQLQFWLEFTKRRAGSDAFDEPDALPEAQLQLYEDCGWRLVAERDNVHVFAAPPDETVPQPYDADDPQQDAMMQQLQRAYRQDILGGLITLPLLIAAIAVWGLAPLQKLLAGWWWGCFWILGLLAEAWGSLYGFLRMRRLRRELRAGQWPAARRHRLFRGVRYALLTLSALCLVVGLAELVLSFRSSYPMPEQAGEIYVVPSAYFGLERTPAEDSFLGQQNLSRVNMVDVGYALPFYTVYEAQEVADGDNLTVWQDVYVLHWDRLAPHLARSLMESGTFADADAYVPVAIEGLDGAWYVPGGMEYVAWKGDKVVYATVLGPNRETRLLPLLEATAALWAR